MCIRDRIVAPMTQLTRKNKKFAWGEDQERSFQEVKARLTSAPVLVVPSGTEGFVILVMHQSWDWDVC